MHSRTGAGRGELHERKGRKGHQAIPSRGRLWGGGKRPAGAVRVEIVSVGTELLLGQIVDTNSAWIADRLAAHGLDCFFQTRVGDNIERIAAACRAALARSEAVILCGGLGPTQDDVTREALGRVMGSPLIRDEEFARALGNRFVALGRTMPESNLRQADVPHGARSIPPTTGTAPGLVCPVGGKVMYAVPGVPAEMKEMVERVVMADLVRRAGSTGTIASRVLRTWGVSEARLAEMVAPRLAELDAEPEGATIAFLASGFEGIKVRITIRGDDEARAGALLDVEEERLRAILGTLVFGVDDEAMENAVAHLLREKGLTMGLAESVTGGLVAARLVGVPGASEWFRGSVVAYDEAVKFSVLGVPQGPVVTEDAARAMADGARRVLHAEVGLSLTGVAGPDTAEGVDTGTVIIGVAGIGAEEPSAITIRLPGERQTVRELATISALDLVRKKLRALV